MKQQRVYQNTTSGQLSAIGRQYQESDWQSNDILSALERMESRPSGSICQSMLDQAVLLESNRQVDVTGKSSSSQEKTKPL